MPFTEPFAKPNPGDFVYGLYSGTKSMARLLHAKCVKMTAEVDAINEAMAKAYSDNRPELIINRLSKLGIQLAVHKNRTLHFCLDKLDVVSVIHKNFTSQGVTETKEHRSVTGTELRWLYRHRENPDVQRIVQFWHDAVACLPPWEKGCPVYSDQWTQYHETNKNKGLNDLAKVNFAGKFQPV